MTAYTIELAAIASQKTLSWPRVVAGLVACELLAIVALVLVISQFYFVAILQSPASFTTQLSLGLAIAGMFLLISTLRGDYRYLDFATTTWPMERLFSSWTMAVACLLLILFLTKSSSDQSRGAIVTVYIAGLVVLGLLRRAAAASCQELARQGRVAARRMLVIGTEVSIANVMKSIQQSNSGIQILGTAVVSKDAFATPASQIEAAVELGRRLQPEEIMIALEWDEKQVIRDLVAAFLALPLSIHLCVEPDALPLPSCEQATIGGTTTITIAVRPLGEWQFALKRCFDLVVAGAAMVILSPIFLAIALAIRLDSPGPIFFRQKRNGFNLRQFEILKFRSMYAEHSREGFRQATANDARVTWVGRFLRKSNLDELPQLINVLRGDMSLVGPRPHPISLDDHFTPRLLLYARRHKVLPGITGWAQVNGYRGITDEEWKMQGRLQHDLYYADNWTIFFDAKILLLTLLSMKAFTNAF